MVHTVKYKLVSFSHLLIDAYTTPEVDRTAKNTEFTQFNTLTVILVHTLLLFTTSSGIEYRK